MSRKTEEGLLRLAERRRAVERQLQALRGAMSDEVGFAPRGRAATLLLLAGAAGLALALRGKLRRGGGDTGRRRRGASRDPLGDL